MTVRKLLPVLALVALFANVADATPDQPGTLDTTWATSSPVGAGRLVTQISVSDSLRGLAAQANGTIVAGGTCENASFISMFCAARYTASGALDTSFNGTGLVTTQIGGITDNATSIVVQPDGKVILAGSCFISVGYRFCAVRYNVNGSLDTSFNGTGKVHIALGTDGGTSTAVALQPDGKIVIAGYCYNGNNYDFCLVRYLPNGSLDTTFNGTGSVLTAVGSDDDKAYAVAIQPDGKILVAGTCITTNADFCVVRYHANGSLDASFGGAGQVVTPVSSDHDSGYAMLVQIDGRILVAGSCVMTPGVSQFCAIRYNSNGSLDLSLNGTGKFALPVGSAASSGSSVAMQDDGKFWIGGQCTGATNPDFCAARFHTDGQLDLGVNGSGKIVTAMGNGFDYSYAIGLQRDGKLLLGGTCHNSATLNNAFCIARYDGGPFAYKACSADLDGDGQVLATTDSLIHARIALGMTGAAVINGVSFAPNATRNTWPLIREHLVTHCGMSLLP